MQIESLAIAGPLVVTGPVHVDRRGAFRETFEAARHAAAGLPVAWRQDNVSHSRAAGTVRGLHWQVGAAAQAKLVTVLAGRILDAAVDLRRGSPTFGRAVWVELDAAINRALYVPVGFAHGFCTLEPDSIVAYKVDAPYDPAAERSLLWADPALEVPWPATVETAVISDKDAAAPPLAALVPEDLFA